MAFQVLQVTFTNEQGPKSVSIPTPAGWNAATMGIVPAGFQITDGDPSAPVGISCDAPVSGTPNSTVNVYSSDLVSGVATLLVVDLP